MFSKQPYTFDRVVRMLMALAIIILAVWLIDTLKGVLLPFAVACVIAYMFEPFVQYNRKLLHLKGRIIAVFVTLFEALFLFAVLCYFMVPMIAEEIHNMGVILQNYAENKPEINHLPALIDEFLRRIIDIEALSKNIISSDAMSTLESLLHSSWELIIDGVSIIMGIVSWFFVIIYVVFIMLDYTRLSRSFKLLVPPSYRHITYQIGRDIKTSMNHYFRGQALVSFIVGILFAIGFSIIGLPMAIVFGLFIGVLNMVPYLQLISLVPAVLLCLVYSVGSGVNFWVIFTQTIAVYCIAQVIQDMILTPKIMGKAMGLNPAIILLSLSVWGTLLGFIGLIIALPLTTLILSYYNHYVIGDNDALKTPKWRKQSTEPNQ
ncbi:MAG: AI-2E family transporter [Paramuribaculum sp.]|nr:AI-2E family transporter [Paramuribaculum sp.]